MRLCTGTGWCGVVLTEVAGLVLLHDQAEPGVCRAQRGAGRVPPAVGALRRAALGAVDGPACSGVTRANIELARVN